MDQSPRSCNVPRQTGGIQADAANDTQATPQRSADCSDRAVSRWPAMAVRVSCSWLRTSASPAPGISSSSSIAAYGTLCALARQLGYDKALPLLEASLEEEKATDEKLTMLAEGGGNQRAAEAA